MDFLVAVLIHRRVRAKLRQSVLIWFLAIAISSHYKNNWFTIYAGFLNDKSKSTARQHDTAYIYVALINTLRGVFPIVNTPYGFCWVNLLRYLADFCIFAKIVFTFKPAVWLFTRGVFDWVCISMFKFAINSCNRVYVWDMVSGSLLKRVFHAYIHMFIP